MPPSKPPSTLPHKNSARLNRFQSLYLGKIIQSGDVNCRVCRVNVTSTPHFYCKNNHLCVGCFSQILPKQRSYKMVDFGTKKNMRALRKLSRELAVLRALQKNGIDSIELIQEQMKMGVTEAELRMYIDSLSTQPYDRGSIKKTSKRSKYIKTDELQDSNLHILSTQPQCRLQGTQTAESLFRAWHQKQYSLSDYLLSSLHPNTDPATVAFMTSFKLAQMEQDQHICQRVDQMLAEVSANQNIFLKPVLQNLKNPQKRKDDLQATDCNTELFLNNQRKLQILQQFKLLSRQATQSKGRKKPEKVKTIKRHINSYKRSIKTKNRFSTIKLHRNMGNFPVGSQHASWLEVQKAPVGALGYEPAMKIGNSLTRKSGRHKKDIISLEGQQ